MVAPECRCWCFVLLINSALLSIPSSPVIALSLSPPRLSTFLLSSVVTTCMHNTGRGVPERTAAEVCAASPARPRASGVHVHLPIAGCVRMCQHTFPIGHLVGPKTDTRVETQVRAFSYANEPLILAFARRHERRTRGRQANMALQSQERRLRCQTSSAAVTANYPRHGSPW